MARTHALLLLVSLLPLGCGPMIPPPARPAPTVPAGDPLDVAPEAPPRRAAKKPRKAVIGASATRPGRATEPSHANGDVEAAYGNQPLSAVPQRPAIVPEADPVTHASFDRVRLILNNPVGHVRPEDACEVELCTSLVELIDGSKTSIDFAIYGMRNQTAVFNAILRAKKRGVRIRGVVDRDTDGKNYYSSTEKLVAALGTVRDDLQAEKRWIREQADKLDPFARGGRTACTRPVGFAGPLQCLAYTLGNQCLLAAHASREDLKGAGAIMHHKYFVFDNAAVWSGSTNASDSGTGGYNANLVTVVRDARVAQRYTTEFEGMWVRGEYHSYKPALDGPWRYDVGDGVQLQVLFSPQHKPITKAILPLLKKAHSRIDVAVFFLTHKGITKELIRAHRRGVKVRVILDATAAKNGYTKHELLRAAGIPLKIEHWGGKMHMKSAVVDDDYVITGSMNWTSAGEGGNDENTIIIHSAAHAEQYARFFDTLWAELPDKWLKGRPDPESKDSTTSCSDGVDNDYDHKPDAADPGCGDSPPELPPLPPWELVPKAGRPCYQMHRAPEDELDEG